MIYIIIESIADRNSIIIDIVEDKNLETKIYEHVEKKYGEFTIIGTNIMDEIFPSGKYLVRVDTNFSLYKKSVEINIFNASNQTSCIKKICEWNILPFKNKLIEKLKYTDEMKTSLSEFKLSQMINNPKILLIAKRGSGKNYIIRNILKHLENLHPNKTNNLIISPTDKMNSFYGSCNLNTKIVYSLEESILYHKSNNNYDDTNYIVYDDVYDGHKSIDDHENLQNTSIIVAMQPFRTLQIHTNDIKKISDLSDYIFLLKDESTSNKKLLWYKLAHMYPSFNEFEKVFDKATKDYGCMVIAKNKSMEDTQYKIYQYREEWEWEW